MRKLTVFMHTSLDGFAAGTNGELDWVTVDDEIFAYVEARVSQTDTALYGRVTYEMMEAYWPTAGSQPGASEHDVNHSKWYNRARKVVLSTTLAAVGAGTRIISENLTEEIKRIKEEPGGEILVFGSPRAAHSLFAAGLVDGLWLFVNPVLLGEGMRAITKVRSQTALQLVGSHVFSSGVVCLDYGKA